MRRAHSAGCTEIFVVQGQRSNHRSSETVVGTVWGSGRPVILIHGWPLSADSWDDQATALAKAGFQTIAYDRRGFGRSSQPWSGYGYNTLADDLAAVIEQTGARDATLVGFLDGRR
jgi:non-heme chloroperoxidase